jgi:hypothetical protein
VEAVDEFERRLSTLKIESETSIGLQARVFDTMKAMGQGTAKQKNAISPIAG